MAPNNRLCEQCNRKPKYADPATGQVHPYCGRSCAATAKAIAKGLQPPPSSGSGNRRGADSNPIAQHTAKLLRTVGEELSDTRRSIGDDIDTDLINRFKQNGVWQFSDVKGGADITMSREFNGETIAIAFSLNKTEPFEDFADIASEAENEDDPDDNDNDNDSLGGHSDRDRYKDLVLACIISISKARKGVMLVQCDAVDGEFEIHSFSFTKDTNLAIPKSAQDEYVCDSMYVSPQFYDLGEQFQEQFVEYLADRGIDSELARFVQQYAKQKEKLEHVNWLEHMQDFLS